MRADAPCLIDGLQGTVLDYGQVREWSCRVAGALHRKPQVRMVGILSPNDMHAFMVQLGCHRAGVMVVPGNARYSVADNIAIFRRFGVDIVFVHPSLRGGVVELAASLPDHVEFVDLGEGDGVHLPALETWSAGEPWDGAEITDPEFAYGIQPTGGTTGEPKGVLMPVREIAFAVDSLLQLAPSQGVPAFLAAVPLTHAAGKFMHYIFAQGGCGVLLPGAEPRMVVDAMLRWKITHTFLPPTVIYGLLDSGLVTSGSLPDLQYLFYGAAPMSPARLANAIRAFGPVMAQVYGQTESGLPNCYLSPADHLAPDGSPADEQRLSAAGRINPLCQVALLGEDGEAVAPGEIGEIAIQGDGVMLEYLDDAKATAEVRKGPWHMTGDMARIDEYGFVHIVDRVKDMIISGGFNIYPAEVERVINSHPAVGDCAVVGIPDDRWGEAVTAVVEVKPGATVAEDELIALCKERIGSLKAPKRVILTDRLPRSPVGKLLKREVRQQFWGEKERLV